MQLDLAICNNFKCLPTEDRFKDLSLYQKLLLFDKITNEKNETIDLLKNCFEILKPWLDRDMFFNIKDEEKKTRINTNLNKKHTYRADIDVPKEYDGDDIIVEE